MSNPVTHAPMALGKRAALLFAAMLAAVTMFFAANVPQASASQNFCYVTLQPYGDPGDRCWGPGNNNLYIVTIGTNERAGCVTTANGANKLLQSWKCAPAWLFTSVYEPDDGVFRKGVIRNNNLSFTGKFTASMSCYNGAC